MKLIGHFLRLILALGLTLFFLLTTSLAQTIQGATAMERFDIETFNRNKSGYIWLREFPDGTKVVQMESQGDGYLVETTLPHSAYTDIKLFNYEGKLTSASQRFFSTYIGVVKEYDSQGHVVKEYDQDKEFSFSVNDLAKKMQAEYGVDITDTREVFQAFRGVDNFSGQEIPVYGLYVYDFSHGKTDTTQTVAYLFQGNTGELLYTISADIEGRPDIISVYRSTIENKLNR